MNLARKVTVLVFFTFLFIGFSDAQMSVAARTDTEAIDPSKRCADVTDIDGNVYKTVRIGRQVWIAENLRAVRYRNGDSIPGNLFADRWYDLISGAQAIYGDIYGYKESNLLEYGRLYNWYAVDDSRGLCPSGWHVPSDAEWTALTDALGGSESVGKKMKSTAWDGTNSSGFSALPGGYRNLFSGDFYGEGSYGQWWSSSAVGARGAWSRQLCSDCDDVRRRDHNRSDGFSVRCVWDSVAVCASDLDGDGVCDGEEVLGCTDPSAANYDEDATEDDGSCIPSSPCAGQSTVTYDGYTYDLVQIGNQCWFKENLRSDNYRNGDPIPGNLSADRWTALTSGAQAVYGEKESNLLKYGRLYNWYAVDDSRGLCPSGWHVPSDAEWTALTDALGGKKVADGKMKSTAWDGTNSSGFSALPGGARWAIDGDFGKGGSYGFWWSSSLAYGTGSAWGRDLSSDEGHVVRSDHHVGNSYSVRCVRDE